MLGSRGAGSEAAVDDGGSAGASIRSAPDAVRPRWAPSDEFEYQPLRIDSRVSRSAAASMLAIRAEFAGWELARGAEVPGRHKKGVAASPALPRAAARPDSVTVRGRPGGTG